MDKILTYFLNYAFDHGFSFTYTNLMSLDAPSLSRSSTHEIVINTNISNEHELPFIMAHEISHLLNHDVGVLYYSTTASRSKIEQSANSRAVDLLLEYAHETDTYTGNYVQFMEQFGIPSKFEELVQSKI